MPTLTPMVPWCGGTVILRFFDNDTFSIQVTETGNDSLVSIGDVIVVPSQKAVVVGDPSLPRILVMVKIEDVILKVT